MVNPRHLPKGQNFSPIGPMRRARKNTHTLTPDEPRAALRGFVSRQGAKTR